MDGDEMPLNGRTIDVPPGLEHLMPAYVAEMEKDLVSLLRLHDAGDSGALSEHAHAMKGKCAMFGDAILFDLLDRLGKVDAKKHELITQIICRIRQLKI